MTTGNRQGRPRKFNNQRDQRRDQRHARHQAARHKGPWQKYTINLRGGTELQMKFENSRNRSAMVRDVFKLFNQNYAELTVARKKIEELERTVQKLVGRLNGTRTNDDVREEE